SVFVLISLATYLLRLFYRLVINSAINFDVNNVLNLSVYSFLGILMLCFAFFIFYLLVEICLTLCSRTRVPLSHQVAILLFGAIASTLISGFNRGEFTLFYILAAVWVVIRGYAYQFNNTRL